LYYITTPRGLDVAAQDPISLVNIIFITAIVTVFGRLWVELGGLSAKSAAKNLLDADKYQGLEGHKILFRMF
jgi:preprotein translocase subunit SecY